MTMSHSFDPPFQHKLTRESWAFYGVGLLIIPLRLFARWRRVRSFTLFAVDDWLMMTLVPAWYTMLVVCLNITAADGGSNLFPPDEFNDFTEEDIKARIRGSKVVVLSEQAMLNLIWTLKACMLFMFARLITGTTLQRYIRYLGIYTALGWVVMQITFFTACRPFKSYWSMPPTDPQCATFEHYAEVQAVFNLSSDFCMLLIPLPMLQRLNLPLRQKCVLGVVFGLGLFVIIAAILTKAYNLSDVYSPVYMLWYVREASVAVYVTNLPVIWPLLRENIDLLRAMTGSYAQHNSVLPTTAQRSHGQGPKVDVLEIYELGRQSFSKAKSKVTTGARSLESDEKPLTEGCGIVGRSAWDKVADVVRVDTNIEIRKASFESRNLGKEGTVVSEYQEKCPGEIEAERRGPRTTITGPNGFSRGQEGYGS